MQNVFISFIPATMEKFKRYLKTTICLFVASFFLLGCWSEQMAVTLTVNLRNTSSEKTALWIGHSEASEMYMVEPSGSRMETISVQAVGNNGVPEVISDKVNVNARKNGGSPVNEKLKIHYDYKEGAPLNVTWNGEDFSVSY